MHNSLEIEAMSSAKAQDLAARLAVQLCGTDAFKTELAARLGYTRAAVNRWFSEGNRPPTIVILYLEAELDRREGHRVLKDLNSAIDAVFGYK